MYKRKTVLWGIFFGLCLYGQGGINKMLLSVDIGETGITGIAGIRTYWCMFDSFWKPSRLEKQSYTLIKKTSGSSEVMTFSGRWKLKTGDVVASDTIIKPYGVNRFNYQMELNFSNPVKTKSLTWHWDIPVGKNHLEIVINKKPLVIPGKPGKRILIASKGIKSIILKYNNNSISLRGQFGILVQDDRTIGKDTICLRFRPSVYQGTINNSKLDLKIEVTSPSLHSLNLKSAMNMGFKDDTADDGKGGWTDQGSCNDLKCLAQKKIQYQNVAFQVIDPASNNGKSCIVLAKPGWRPYPKSKPVEINSNISSKYLYLVHASAWTPAEMKPTGEIEIEFANGKRQTILVLSGRDCNNWWNPMGGNNCAVAWSGNNGSATTGLYVSQFPLDYNNPQKITFRNNNKSVWMIVAATLGTQKLDLTQSVEPLIIKAGKEWKKLDFSREIVSGSPLDFSRQLDAPAGKYGSVIITADGKFAFENAQEKRIRFWGNNICNDVNCPSHTDAVKFADNMAKRGYNSIRLHHLEKYLKDKKSDNTSMLGAEATDRFYFLFNELKKRGIYICLDLYSNRKVLSGNNINECRNADSTELKLLIPFSESALNDWKNYSRNLIGMKNPYTGMTLAQDPALYSLNLVNEAVLMLEWNRYPALVPLIEKRYEEYLKKKGIFSPELAKTRKGEFLRFLNEVQEKCTCEQIRFLRDELKLKALITNVNYCNSISLQGLRSGSDFVDNHVYQDSPRFKGKRWQYPFLHNQRSALIQMARVPRLIMPTRIFNKPFTVTEFNFANPNKYRSEAGPLMGAYAALQDWDGLYRFAWSHFRSRLRKPARGNSFDTAQDPVMMLGDYIINHLYLRGDVKPSDKAAAFVFDDKMMYDINNINWSTASFPDKFHVLGLYCKIGSLPAGRNVPGVEKTLPSRRNFMKGLSSDLQKKLNDIVRTRHTVSSTRQIELNVAKNIFKVITPKSEAFILEKGMIKGKFMRVENADVFSVFMVSSLDDKELTDSNNLIVFHITNVTNSGIKFKSKAMRELLNWGRAPLLVKVGRADIVLKTGNKTSMKVRALKLDGSFQGTVPYKQLSEGYIRFSANTDIFPGGTMIYHISMD